MLCRDGTQHPWRERERLVLKHMPLARRIARTYHAPLHQEDVEQVAYLALVKAAERFDPRRGHRFVTFAIPTIRGEIKHYLRDHSWDVHVPRLLQERALQAQRVSNELAAELGRAPTAEELAARLGVAPDTAREAIGATAARDARSLDAPAETDPSDRPCGYGAQASSSDEDALARVLDRVVIRSALEVLSEQERQAVALRFFGDLTQSEIARQIGISQMQVSRVLRRALGRMAAAADGLDPAGLDVAKDDEDVSAQAARGTARRRQGLRRCEPGEAYG